MIGKHLTLWKFIGKFLFSLSDGSTGTRSKCQVMYLNGLKKIDYFHHEFLVDWLVQFSDDSKIVNNAEMNNRIPIDTYKSKSNESLMNSAPLNKSALKINFIRLREF